jgi:hypothetical protein
MTVNKSQIVMIELMRRWDEALGILKSSHQFYLLQDSLKATIARNENRLTSKWLWLAFAGGIALNYFLPDSGQSGAWSIGSIIMGICGLIYAGTAWDGATASKRLNEVRLHINLLEGKWLGVIGSDNLGESNRFIDNEGLSEMSPEYGKWLAVQKRQLEWHVQNHPVYCGQELGL